MGYKKINSGSSLNIIKQLQKMYTSTFENNILLINNDDLELRFELFQPFDGIEVMKHEVLYKKDIKITVPGSTESNQHIYLRFEYLGKVAPFLAKSDKSDTPVKKANIMSAINSQVPIKIVAQKDQVSKWVTMRVTYDYFKEKMKDTELYVGKVFEPNSQWAIFDIAPLEVYSKLEEIFNCSRNLSYPLNNTIVVGNVIICVGVFLDRIIKREKGEISTLKSKVFLHEDDILRMNEIKNELLSTYEKTPPLTFFVEKYGISVSKLKRDFSVTFGTTIHRFHANYKLELAHIMLAKEKRTITEIARYFGYSSVSKFSIAFKNKFNITPKEVAIRYQ